MPSFLPFLQQFIAADDERTVGSGGAESLGPTADGGADAESRRPDAAYGRWRSAGTTARSGSSGAVAHAHESADDSESTGARRRSSRWYSAGAAHSAVSFVVNCAALSPVWLLLHRSID